jgi:hypothetical protein
LPHNQRARWKNVTGSPPTCHLHHKHRTLFNIQFLVPHRHIHGNLSSWGVRGGKGMGWGATHPLAASLKLGVLG